MEFENKSENAIKVSVEDTNPRQWKTLYKGDKIEAKSSVHAKAYEEAGLVQVGKKKPKDEAPEETAEPEKKPEPVPKPKPKKK